MEAMNRGMAQVPGRQEAVKPHGLLGQLSERTAQMIALVITLLTFGGISYAINTLFTSMGQ